VVFPMAFLRGNMVLKLDHSSWHFLQMPTNKKKGNSLVRIDQEKTVVLRRGKKEFLYPRGLMGQPASYHGGLAALPPAQVWGIWG
jgi:hypothetical protein